MSREHDSKRPPYDHIIPRARKRPGASPAPIPTPPPRRSHLHGGASSELPHDPSKGSRAPGKPTTVPDGPQTRSRWRTTENENKVEKPKRADQHAKVGYKSPPVEHRFKKGCPPGPGRPKGSKSQDTLLRAELEARHPIRIGGRERHVAKRVLAAKLYVNGALEKRVHKQLSDLNTEARRLFPDAIVEAEAQAAHDPAKDREFLRAFIQQLSMGEPRPDATDLLEDMMSGGLDLVHGGDQDTCGEEDWDTADGEASDEDR